MNIRSSKNGSAEVLNSRCIKGRSCLGLLGGGVSGTGMGYVGWRERESDGMGEVCCGIHCET